MRLSCPRALELLSGGASFERKCKASAGGARRKAISSSLHQPNQLTKLIQPNSLTQLTPSAETFREGGQPIFPFPHNPTVRYQTLN